MKRILAKAIWYLCLTFTVTLFLASGALLAFVIASSPLSLTLEFIASVTTGISAAFLFISVFFWASQNK